MKNTPENIQKILEYAGSRFTTAHFIKADGTDGKLCFNPKHVGPILGTGKPNNDPALFKRWDIKKKGWRSFRADRVFQINACGQVFHMSAEGVED